MNRGFLIRRMAGGMSMTRAMLYERLSNVVLEGHGLDLGAKKANSYHNTHLRGKRSVIYSDLEPRSADVIRLDLNERFPFADCTQDFVMLFSVLECIFDPSNCMSESFRVLKPGGRFIGATSFLSRITRDPVDYHRYTGDGLGRTIRDAGFDPVNVEPIGAGPFSAGAHLVMPLIRPYIFRPPLAILALSGDAVLRAAAPRGNWRELYALTHYFEAYRPTFVSVGTGSAGTEAAT